MQEEDLFNELIMTVFAEQPLALPYFGDLKFMKQKNIFLRLKYAY